MIRPIIAVAAIAGTAFCVSPYPAAAGGLAGAAELEAARANARAGGPVSEHDAWLLERYGCTSGTQNAFCEELDEQRRHGGSPRAKKPRRSQPRY